MLYAIVIRHHTLIFICAAACDQDHSSTDNKDCTDEELKRRVVMACPAKLYRIEEDGRFTFNYEGCLECGTCRVLAGGRAIKSWNHPMGGMGVWFRKG